MSKPAYTKKARAKLAMGESPLDALLGGTAREPAQAATKASRRGLEVAEPSPKRAPAAKPKKVRATFHLPAALFEKARDAVVSLSGPPERLTMARLAEDALRHELERLKRKHNEGEDFPTREGPVRTGRPVGS